jgi:DNA ligase-1
MRFPRISRLRWDKPPRDADRLETLEKLLKSDASNKVLVTSGGF